MKGVLKRTEPFLELVIAVAYGFDAYQHGDVSALIVGLIYVVVWCVRGNIRVDTQSGG